MGNSNTKAEAASNPPNLGEQFPDSRHEFLQPTEVILYPLWEENGTWAVGILIPREGSEENTDGPYGEFDTIAAIHDPCRETFGLDENRLEWLLQDHYKTFPFDKARAAAIRKELNDYGDSLLRQLGLITFIANADFFDLDAHVRLGRMDLRLNIVDGGMDNFHWETLQAAILRQQIIPNLAIHSIVVRSIIPGTNSDRTQRELIHRSQRPSPNILIVASRSYDRDDIDPLLGSRAITDVRKLLELETGGSRIIDVVRSGTWPAFVEHIEKKTQEWWKGGGTGPYYDVVHFDVHGKVINGQAYLLFLHSSRNKLVKRSSHVIGQLLGKNMVTCAVINACESAKTVRETRANLARDLVNYGVQEVIGMSFELSNRAAEIFIRSFYFRLYANVYLETVEAMASARKALANDPIRIGRLNVSVELPDSIVPVIYRRANNDSLLLPSRWDEYVECPALLIWDRNHSDAATNYGMHASLVHGEHSTKEEKDFTLEGREQDVLEVEWNLLLPQQGNVLLIHGFAGVGKTAFLKFLGKWWRKTGFIDVVIYCGLRGQREGDNLQRLEKISAFLQDNSTSLLIVIDDLDSVMKTGERRLSECYQSKLDALVARINGSSHREFLVFASRCAEVSIAIPPAQRLKLPQLSAHHADRLAGQIAQRIGWGKFLDKELQLDYIHFLTAWLNYNPLAIKLALLSAKGSCDLVAQNPGFTQFERLPTSPQNLFHVMLLANVSPISIIGLEPTLTELFSNFIPSIFSSGPLKEALALMSLTLVVNIYEDSWYDVAASSLAKAMPDCAPTSDEIRDFVKRRLIWSGWVEEFEATTAGVSFHYFRIHHALTNLLRISVLTTPRFRLVHQQLTEDFMLHHSKWALEHSEAYTHHHGRLKVQLQVLNLLASYNLLHDSLVKDAAPKNTTLMMYVLIKLLWETARCSTTPVLSSQFLLERLVQCTSTVKVYLEDALLAGDEDYWIHFDAYSGLCHCLCAYHAQRNPRITLSYSQEYLQFAIRVTGKGEQWDDEHRRLGLAFALAHVGWSVFAINCFYEARMAFNLTLRCLPSYSSSSQQVENLILRRKAWAGMLLVGRELHISEEDLQYYNRLHEQAEVDYHRHAAAADRLDFQSMDPALIGRATTDENLEDPSKIRQAAQLTKQGQIELAQDILLSALTEATLRADHGAQYAYATELAEIAMNARDWDRAVMHIRHIWKLGTGVIGGRWMIVNHYDSNNATDSVIRFARYGATLIRKRLLDPALHYMYRSLQARVRGGDTSEFPSDLNDPKAWIDIALYSIRFGLSTLAATPRCIISPAEYNEIDDEAQNLILAALPIKYPQSDGNMADFEKKLKRKFVVTQGLSSDPTAQQADFENAWAIWTAHERPLPIIPTASSSDQRSYVKCLEILRQLEATVPLFQNNMLEDLCENIGKRFTI